MKRWLLTTTIPPIGQPATRALDAAGITRLEQLQQHRAEDLLALHGVGPKAIAILQAALVAKGLSFQPDRSRRELPSDVQAYIDALDGAHRRLFEHLHALILDDQPDADVVLAYQIPLYKVGRRHVGLNAGRADGVTLTTTSPDHIEVFRRQYPDFKTNKASIQFRFDDELPDDGIREVIRRAIAS